MKRFFAGAFMLFCLSVPASRSEAENKTIVFLGDSLTAGYGLVENQSFPSLIQEYLEQDGLSWRVVNAGISGDTTAGSSKRLNWVLKSSPTVVFVALGANDGLRGLNPDVTRKNLESIVVRSKRSGALVILAGMQLPINYGADYRRKFRDLFPEIAREHKTPYYPFLLEGVASKPEFNLSDGVHPNEAGQKLLADKIYAFIKPLLQKM